MSIPATARRLFAKVDMTVRLLVLAIVLASVLPATGEARPVVVGASNIGIMVLFFMNGLRLSRADIARGLRNWRFMLPLFLWCFGAMAVAGLGLSHLTSTALPLMVSIGFIFLGVLPSTVQSATAYSSLARGDVAHSVVAAALLNIAGVFVTMPLFALLSGGVSGGSTLDGLVKIGWILIAPFVLGQLLQSRLHHWLTKHKAMVGWMDRIAIALAVYVAFSGAVEQGIWTRLDLASWAILLGCIAVFLLFGFVGAWWLGGRLPLSRADRISFLFAGAQKSTAMGAPMALVLFPAADAGLLMVPLLLYHLLQLVISAPIAQHLAIKPGTP